MKFHELFPSKYLAGPDLKDKPRGVRLVIKTEPEFEDMGKGKFKPVMYFRGVEKGLVMNRTNGDTIKEVYGDDCKSWIGKTIILYFDPKVMMGAERKGGLRVRIPDGIATQSPPADEPPPPDEEPVFDDSEDVL